MVVAVDTAVAEAVARERARCAKIAGRYYLSCADDENPMMVCGAIERLIESGADATLP